MRLVNVLAIAAIVFVLPVAPVAAAQAATRPFSVTITHVECVDDCDEAGLEKVLEGEADFFARVAIDGVIQPDTARVDDDANINPYWVVPAQVPDTLANVPVVIQIVDYDSSSGEDIGDVSAHDGDSNLDFTVNYATGQWFDPTNEDGVEFPETCSTGDGGDNDQPRVKVCFDVSAGVDGDTDDDGIPDAVERFGMPDGNGNLSPFINMPMDPCRKTIALEIDWMVAGDHTHRPTDGAVNDAIAAMNAAPVPATTPCPYPGFPTQPNGVNLVVVRSNAIPEQPVFQLSSLAGVRDGGNFSPARRPYMHYVLFVHDQKAGDSSSGMCCVDHRDFIVSLGSWANQVGIDRDQSGSILHELGHSLALGHGGVDGTNYKPNYLSVMNYAFDPLGIPDPTIAANIDTDGDGNPDKSFRLDYSSSKLADLVESSLDESVGIRDGTDQTTFWDPAYQLQTGAGTGGIDWNQVGGTAEPRYKQDLNRDFCVGPGANGTLDTTTAGDDTVVANLISPGPDFVCNTAKSGDDVQNTARGTNVLSTLTGYDDWSNIKYRAAMSVSAGGADQGHEGDISFEEAESNKHGTFALFSPDLELAKTVDRSNAAPGQTLTYTVTARNTGTGAAASVTMVDTLPDGSAATHSLGTMLTGGSETRTIAYDVPCDTADGTTLTNRATVSGTNLLNNPEVDTSDNGASASTTVHAPVVTLAKTATSPVNAGEPITYRLTYENTGSGDARSAAIVDTLPAGMYYSTALDLGAGPRPSSVVRDAAGTTTMTWSLGTVSGASGPQTIEYTARPSLLSLAGVSMANAARLTFTDAGGCQYAPVTASAQTTITAVPPTRDPLSQGYWSSHPEQWTSEILARIQATDQAFDGAGGALPDGRLSPGEVSGTFTLGGTSPTILRQQLLATYFNLATRRINAATAIRSKTATRLHLVNVRAAVLFATATLALPPDTKNRDRYNDAIRILDEINTGKSAI
jgi:uncharacterized repeat protein (TIGR01451 family)